MRVLIQRVKNAKIVVEEKEIARIQLGLLLFVGIKNDDSLEDLEYMARKVLNLRIFEDSRGKMNLNVKQTNAGILSLPQFTFYADTKSGNRTGFDDAAKPPVAKELWEKFNALLAEGYSKVKAGVFSAHMHVELINDGPVTIWLDSKLR